MRYPACMSADSLSTYIESLQKAWAQPEFEALLARLHASPVGVLAGKNKPDEPIQATLLDGEPIALSSTTHGDGLRRIVAFAEPHEFVKRFGPRLNAEVSGKTLMEVVLENEGCHGIILNSATSANSITIGRNDIQRYCSALLSKQVP
jgi:hypothetical protein